MAREELSPEVARTEPQSQTWCRAMEHDFRPLVSYSGVKSILVCSQSRWSGEGDRCRRYCQEAGGQVHGEVGGHTGGGDDGPFQFQREQVLSACLTSCRLSQRPCSKAC